MNKDLKDRVMKHAQSQQAAKPDPIRTKEELIEILGLDPDFKGLTHPDIPKGRATGRTTRMLVEALFVMQTGPVYVQGSSWHTKRLRAELEAMAIKAGVSLKNLVPYAVRPERLKGYDCVIFDDPHKG